MEAQLRMRNSKILLITMRGLANEVAKNLVLAGIGSLTVMDPEVVEEDDLGASFFFSEEHVGQNVRHFYHRLPKSPKDFQQWHWIPRSL